MPLVPVLVPFIQSKGLSMQDVFILQGVFAGAVVVMEMPAGYLADFFGRRFCLLLGGLFYGIGSSLLLFVDGFWTLVLFEVALGIGSSLVSGADLALLYDSELASNRSLTRQRQVVSWQYAVRTLAGAASGVVCTVLLWRGSLDLVVAVQAVLGWLPLLLAWSLAEPPVSRLSGTSHRQNWSRILRYLFASDRLLRLTFLALCLWTLVPYYAVWLLPRLWQLQDIELTHFGYLWAALYLVGAVAGRWAHRLEARLGVVPTLVCIGLGPVLAWLLLGMAGTMVGLIAACGLFALRGLGNVILVDALNHRLPGEFRATINSLASVGFCALFMLTGPFLGRALDLWGMAAVTWVLAGVSAFVFLCLMLPLIVAAGGMPPTQARSAG